jgi:Rrf2 family iron-sulfur cluster assembly transcriptional regulator
MDIIRRNTDYALRALVFLARQPADESVSTRTIADQARFSYQLACKLMQRLQKAGLVVSCMGAKGGFQLARTPQEITLGQVVETIQGPLSLSSCLLGKSDCCNRSHCTIRNKLGELQSDIAVFLEETTLADFVEKQSA